MKATLDRVKELRRDLDRVEKDVGVIRDKLEELLEDAKEELRVVDEAKDALDRLIDLLSENH